MKRRIFIKNTLVSSAYLSVAGLGFQACNIERKKHLTILHTNDVHSQIDPYESSHPMYPNMGGAAKRATLVAQVRKENPNTLLLDAGDIFQGTPYFNFYGGELEMKLMSMMGYDAATFGNHDFDGGIDGLLAQMPNTKFGLLSANYDFSNTVMAPYVKPYQVFVKDGIRIGVFGLGIELKGLVDPRMFKETKYLDPIEIAQDTTRKLKHEENCDLVICLSHLGYRYDHEKVSDEVLASQTQDIDLIIGGHTHTLMETPATVLNKNNKEVIINQVGYKGVFMGRIDFFFEEGKTEVSSQKLAVV